MKSRQGRAYVAVLVVLVLLAAAWIPLALALDRFYGVEGYEMREVYPADTWAANVEANGPQSVTDYLDVYGTPVGAPVPRRFVFVPAERIHRTPYGHTLIRFDRTAGEEYLQARTLRNLSYLLTAGNVAALLLTISGVTLWRRWTLRKQAHAT